ncbi:MAG: alpha-amylase family glycosyl hydrolase, partial [Pseudomonadota bacterium]
DLNFHNMDVQDALLDVTRFWLDRGVDGFRLDTINFYVHDAQLRDNPALSAEARNDTIAPSVNPYNFQDHLFDKNQPENLAFLRRFRGLLDEYEATTCVGEVGDAQYGMKIQADYTSGGDKVHMCYAFDFLAPTPLTGSRVAEILADFEQEIGDGWACWAFSNHDVVRHASRWNLDEGGMRVHAALLMAMRGSICLYQGEELGLTEAYVSFEELQDPYGIQFWPKFKGRDGCRTPMVWEQSNAYAGFSEGKPWLPVAMEHLPRAASIQEGDPGSLLNFYRAALALRRSNRALIKGDVTFGPHTDGLVSFERRCAGQRAFCAFNLGQGTETVSLPEGDWALDRSLGFSVAQDGRTLSLPPQQAAFAFAAD